MNDTIINTIKDTKKTILSIFDNLLESIAVSILVLSAIQSKPNPNYPLNPF